MAGNRTASDFGGRLREARERRGVSLRQIANATKISVGVLEALERNDISKLPGGIFGRAFVRSYAVEVGLDPERTIEDFITQFPGDSITAGHPGSHQVDTHVAVETNRRRLSALFSLTTMVVVVAGAAVYSGAWRTLVSYVEPLFTMQAWRLPALMRPDAPVQTPRPEPAPAESSAPGGESATPVVAPPPPPLPGAAVRAGDRLAVRLSVSRPCFISATVDGRKVIEGILQIGEEQRVDVRREMVLTAQDAGAVALTLNGVDAKPLGAAGEVVTFRLSLANFRDFLATR
jgi:cytoskeleton protein RodZ